MITQKNSNMIFAQKRINLEISDISYGYLDNEWDLRDVRSSFTRVYFPTKGEGILTVGDEQIRLCPGNIYILPSGLCFSGHCPDQMEKIFVHLTLTSPNGADIFYGTDRCTVVKDSQQLIERVTKLYSENSIMSALEFKRLIYELLINVLGDNKQLNESMKSYSSETISVIDYINEHLSASLTIDGITSALFLQKGKLQKKFKEDTGKSVGQYIDSCLSMRAEAELLDSSLSICDISEKLGYCDQFYFSRQFKKTHGISPRVFRKKHGI